MLMANNKMAPFCCQSPTRRGYKTFKNYKTFASTKRTEGGTRTSIASPSRWVGPFNARTYLASLAGKNAASEQNFPKLIHGSRVSRALPA
jgi:hypothetical protein